MGKLRHLGSPRQKRLTSSSPSTSGRSKGEKTQGSLELFFPESHSPAAQSHSVEMKHEPELEPEPETEGLFSGVVLAPTASPAAAALKWWTWI